MSPCALHMLEAAGRTIYIFVFGLKVYWDSLSAGLVVIVVASYSIALPLTTYDTFSLVVQGSFTGELQSAYNPGWSGATTTICSLPVAHISSAPAVLSNVLTPSFTFATTTDPATNGFQCKLTGTGGSTTASSGRPLQDWTACTSPQTFTFTSAGGANDGAYLFQVRATGETCGKMKQDKQSQITNAMRLSDRMEPAVMAKGRSANLQD